jgi:hypothetical protein
MMSIFLLLAAADSAPAVTKPEEISEPNPKIMTQQEIREFNTSLARNHPFYIRCVKSVPIGSLIKRNFSCRTNRQWSHADDVGNQGARDIWDRMSSKASNGN